MSSSKYPMPQEMIWMSVFLTGELDKAEDNGQFEKAAELRQAIAIQVKVSTLVADLISQANQKKKTDERDN